MEDAFIPWLPLLISRLFPEVRSPLGEESKARGDGVPVKSARKINNKLKRKPSGARVQTNKPKQGIEVYTPPSDTNKQVNN